MSPSPHPSTHDARYWLSTYVELLHLQEQTLARLRSLAAGRLAAQRERLEHDDIEPLTEMIAFTRGRLAFWEHRRRQELNGTAPPLWTEGDHTQALQRQVARLREGRRDWPGPTSRN